MKKLFPLLATLLVLCGASQALAARYPTPYPALIAEAREIERYETIMPLRIFHLATRFAEAPDPELTARLAKDMLCNSPNRFVRRVGYTTLRMMAQKSYRSIDQTGLIMQGLEDPDDWVRHDAVWAGQTTKLDTPAFREALETIAAGLNPDQYASAHPSDARGQLKKRAGLLLTSLRAKK